MSRCYKNELIDIDINTYNDDQDLLYRIFKEELLNNISLNGMPVKFREYPPEGLDKEEAFYHLTCTDYKKQTDKRYFDPQRSRRIRLIKPMIENINKCNDCTEECNGILLWSEKIGNKHRYHLYLQEMDYLVILERRSNYYQLVSAFYVYPAQVDNIIDRYNKNKIEKLL